MAIDVGSAAIVQPSVSNPNYTIISLTNPANASGIINSVEVYCSSNLTGFKAATFFLVSGTTYECRAIASIGNVTGGSKQTFSGLSIAVVTGDFIGFYFATGNNGVYINNNGGAGQMFVSGGGDYATPTTQAVYTLGANDLVSLYGTGLETQLVATTGIAQII